MEDGVTWECFWRTLTFLRMVWQQVQSEDMVLNHYLVWMSDETNSWLMFVLER